MNNEVAGAFAVIEGRIKSLNTTLDDLKHEIGVLENRKVSVRREVKNQEKALNDIQEERDKQLSLTDSKNTEMQLKAIALKQKEDNLNGREENVESREQALDIRELRIKDREQMYG